MGFVAPTSYQGLTMKWILQRYSLTIYFHLLDSQRYVFKLFLNNEENGNTVCVVAVIVHRVNPENTPRKWVLFHPLQLSRFDHAVDIIEGLFGNICQLVGQLERCYFGSKQNSCDVMIIHKIMEPVTKYHINEPSHVLAVILFSFYN